MSKPTPGPWRVVNTKEEQYDGDYIADLSNDLLIVPPSIHFLGDPLADAALIAAAPDLLAALQTMVKAFLVYAPKTEGAEYNCVTEASAAIERERGNV